MLYLRSHMRTEYRIRRATAADLAQVVELDDDAFSPYGTAEDMEIIAARLAVFPDGFVVLEQDGAILGYGSSEKWSAEREPTLNEHPSKTHDPAGQILCITAMAVRLVQQRQGYGTALLQHLIGIAQQHRCRQIILETTHAQAFYMKHGFHTAREREQQGIVLMVLTYELTTTHPLNRC